jgi:two-component system, cell cycle sensor histidine kinase and response regulator CckA
MREVCQPETDVDGRVVASSGFLFDITERKADEEALRRLEEQLRQAQKMEAVGRLAGGVAHDFNNVLLVIRGYSHVLMSMFGEGGDGWAEAKEIETAATRASELIRQLLAFSRSQVMQTQIVDLNEIVANTQMLLQPLIGEDVELHTSLDVRLAPVKADVSQLEQAIVNLTVNARDAMPNGGSLLLSTRNVAVDTHTPDAPSLPPGTYTALTVEDTGVGMDEETKARVFEPFFTTKGARGSGLGLSTVYGMVKQSGGDITVVSAPGEGTTMTIYLPQAREVVAVTAPAAPEVEDAASAETVLLVEDDDKARALVGRLLRESGYTVHEAGLPEDALRFCDEHNGQIDLLLSDVVMPQMSGPTLAKHIIERRPGLPVLFVSGYIERADDVDIVSSGADFLQKPFTPHELVPDRAARPRPARPVGRVSEHAQERILVVDDEPAIRELMRRLLEHAGLMSGVHDPQLADTALTLGAYGYMVKPFSPAELSTYVLNCAAPPQPRGRSGGAGMTTVSGPSTRA